MCLLLAIPQTNLKRSAERTAALDVASAVEHKNKAQILEEALQLREELMGREYGELIKAALAVRFCDNPEDRLAAIESLRDDIQGATPDGSVLVEAAIAKIRARRFQPA
jgi:hypothetical protein